MTMNSEAAAMATGGIIEDLNTLALIFIWLAPLPEQFYLTALAALSSGHAPDDHIQYVIL